MGWPLAPLTRTLAVMAAKDTTPPSDPLINVDPFAWSPDPLVVVSRRPRIVYFPEVLLTRGATDAERKAWAAEGATSQTRGEVQLALNAGVTFLGEFTSAWAYLGTTPGHAPAGAPEEAKRLIVMPYTNGASLLNHPGNKDRERQRLRPDRVREAMARILAYMQTTPDARLFEAADGYDAPELQVLNLSAIFRQRDEASQQAHATILSAVPHTRNYVRETRIHIGALHDYAIRDRAARPILDACRTWAAKKKVAA